MIPTHRRLGLPSSQINCHFGSYFSRPDRRLGKFPHWSGIDVSPIKPPIHCTAKDNAHFLQLAHGLQIRRHQCKPLTPNKSAPQPCSAGSGVASECWSSCRPSNVGHGAALRRHPSSCQSPRTISGSRPFQSARTRRNDAPLVRAPGLLRIRTAVALTTVLFFIAIIFGALAGKLGAQTYTFSKVASLYSNTGVAVDAAGNAFATAFYSHTIVKISPLAA